MKQSSSHDDIARPCGLHVAIIMDGNGRWATGRGLGRSAGHRAGGDAVHRIVEAAPALGIGALTLYAFSSENWKRDAAEISDLMNLMRRFIRAHLDDLIEQCQLRQDPLLESLLLLISADRAE